MFFVKVKIADLEKIANCLNASSYHGISLLLTKVDFNGKLELSTIKDQIIDSHIFYDTRKIPSKIKVLIEENVGDLNYELDYLVHIYPIIEPKINVEKFTKVYPALLNFIQANNFESGFGEIAYSIQGKLESEKPEENNGTVSAEGNTLISESLPVRTNDNQVLGNAEENKSSSSAEKDVDHAEESNGSN